MTFLNRVYILFTLLAVAFYSAPAFADVFVETADGRVVVRSTSARLAAWKPAADSIAVLAEGEGNVSLPSVPRGLQASVVNQPGVHGVVLRGTTSAWTALQQDGQWLLREGKPAQPQVSALMLRDGWRVNGVSVKPRDISLDGVRWLVAPVSSPMSVQGSVVGVIRQNGKAAATAVSSLTPSLAKNNLQRVSVDQMLARLQPSAGPATHEPLAAPAGVVEAAVSEQVGKQVGAIPFHKAEALQAVRTPHALSETISLLPALEIYIPGQLVSLTVPQDILLMEPSSSTEPFPEEELGMAPAQEAPQALRGLFPPREGVYQDGLSRAMQAVAEADEDSSAARKARIDLAAFYLAWERPEEAVTALSMLPLRKDGLPTDPLARLYMGLARMAAGHEVAANAFDQKGVLASDAALWRAVLLSQGEDYGAALHEWPTERGVLPRYPSYMREAALLAQATALVRVGDKAIATKTVDAMAEEYAAGTAPAGLVRLQGLVRLGTPDEAAGLKYLADAAEDMRDPAQAYRAKFEFVQALRQRKDLADAQVIKYLEDLWLDWRGDSLERDVLGALADLYDKNNHPREALERWQALVRAFPNLPDINLITERMTQAFVDVFDPENPQTYDLLTYLGLYYDFRELVPNDARGDKVQEQVAKLLTDATLWDRAAPVLEQQINYRPLDATTQNRMVLLLAEVYRRQGHPAESLKLLDKWQRVAATNSSEVRQWKMAGAEALLELNRPDSAKKELAGLNDPEALRLRVQTDWRQKNWKGAIASLQGQLKPVAASQVVSDTAAQLAIFQLAYAYGQLKDASGLEALKSRYATALSALPDLADGVNAVAAVSGIDEVDGKGALAPLTVALADINSLTATIGRMRLDDEKVIKDREEYNNRMRYMDLLPPPAL